MNSDRLTVTSPATAAHPAGSRFQLSVCRTFLISGALLGACYAVLLPPFQAPDEPAHLYRAYTVSEGFCIAPVLSPIPHSITGMAAVFRPNVQNQWRLHAGDISEFLRIPLDDARREGVWNHAINVYNCAPYVPAALGILAGRIFHASPASILYLARFSNLAAYLAIVSLALLLLPDFRLGLLSLALMPMALHQAASASWDAISFASAFFLCAYITRLAWDSRIKILRGKHYSILVAAILAGSLCKANVWLALLLLSVPASKFGSTRRKWAVLLGCGLLALLVIAGWNALNHENMAQWLSSMKDRQQIDFPGNAALVYQHPWMFFRAFLRTLTDWPEMAAQFAGTPGWMTVHLPAWIVWTYFMLLGLVSLTGTGGIQIPTGDRLVLLGVFGVAAAFTFIAMWCANTPNAQNVLAGGGHIAGVQGRYFIPFAFPVLLAFSNLRLRMNRKWLLSITALAALTANAVALEKIRSTYYLAAGEANNFENKLVQRYGSKPEDGKVFIVHGGRKQWILHAGWFARHGYHWPQDVLLISAAQLASIPEGPPIDQE